MKNFKMISLIFLAFIVGCASVQIAEFVVPTLRANQQNVQKWEYFCFKSYKWGSGPISPESTMEKANKLGKEGWEMVAANNGNFCFKRPI